jgi:hypothetical protein
MMSRLNLTVLPVARMKVTQLQIAFVLLSGLDLGLRQSAGVEWQQTYSKP